MAAVLGRIDHSLKHLAGVFHLRADKAFVVAVCRACQLGLQELIGRKREKLPATVKV
jgi:hypothetical protein